MALELVSKRPFRVLDGGFFVAWFGRAWVRIHPVSNPGGPTAPGPAVDSPYLLHLLSPEPFVRDCSRRGQVSGQQRPAICSGASPSSPWFRAFWAWPAARNPCVSSTASGTHRQSAHRSVHDSRSFSYLIHPEASHLALQTCADWSILMAGVLFLGPILSPRRKSLPGSL